MQTLNRKIQPGFKTIDKIKIIKAEKHLFDNNVSLYTINAGLQDVVKIDFLFSIPMQLWYKNNPLIAPAANLMLQDGTKNLTSVEIAEKLDFYGAFLHLNTNKDYSTVTLFSLNKYLPKTLKIIEDIIKNSVFPQKEFEIFIQKKKQQFIVENEKVKTLASRKFSQVLFVENHPYGKVEQLKDYNNLTTRHLSEYYNSLYVAKNCKIIASGKINKDIIKLFDNCFGRNDWDTQFNIKANNFEIKPSNQKTHLILKDDSLQSAIRIGKPLFNKLHPDYTGMQVLNTVLGGYFGSRLMSNIREDKGYTYGIGSFIASLKNAGYFAIATEVGTDVCKNAIKEIYFEIKKIRNELIPENELNLVKNYILGEMLRIFDGPFSLAESFRSILEYNLDYSYFDKFIDTVKNITSKELNTLANKYLDEDSMLEAIAGKDQY